ncbi:MAG: pyridoxamine 5'-phosphate oxidase family protein [Gemmatimonadetes bacterium]|uniref:Pyridoxamine 5'-phosphate oxidase family protein n=1 Tax=Candidatus Kutchimonas denitrificans TaxID=3056748 RepID=A0AAE4Z7P8_9BACT|nr:pyridoxamine 5'-phosphate oxidase family protein [Gemmatimonadota bacterium]NIR74002.1 pyridoxamine 5'-phosphate oxidase family protein [Candidatus Kutchimonas denitrificans]NIS02991.1 pyridoxamine 5'-phosphate oxidase family protein [Gemmatimonadota bacterium]NIT68708.1 pyridoxamine 5'-phosphate oxidase family protein [Gemmatimonadota bacterium]NIU53289.1 pyridoxamine 5'-phosphate oxidase [Gemmatimonadota bacterium]
MTGDETSRGARANPMRRHDRAQSDEWIRAFLHSGSWGALATIADGQPFINTNLYVYDEENGAIYLHTARSGRTRTNLEGGAPVCFSVSEMGRILPTDTALDFSVEYAGVTVFGRGAVVEEDEEKFRALQLLMDKYAPQLEPNRDYRPPNQAELDRTSVYRIEIESWSGKMNRKAADFPGAYDYEDQRRPSPFAADGSG